MNQKEAFDYLDTQKIVNIEGNPKVYLYTAKEVVTNVINSLIPDKNVKTFLKTFVVLDKQILLMKENNLDDVTDDSPYKLVQMTEISNSRPVSITHFKTKEERDNYFKNYDVADAEEFVANVTDFILTTKNNEE